MQSRPVVLRPQLKTMVTWSHMRLRRWWQVKIDFDHFHFKLCGLSALCHLRTVFLCCAFILCHVVKKICPPSNVFFFWFFVTFAFQIIKQFLKKSLFKPPYIKYLERSLAAGGFWVLKSGTPFQTLFKPLKSLNFCFKCCSGLFCDHVWVQDALLE